MHALMDGLRSPWKVEKRKELAVANNDRGRVPEQERCKGTSRQSKQRCKRRRSPGSEFCIHHGGRVPKGGAHPNYKDGRRSKYMPRGMHENFERCLNDPELAHHRASIALVDALIDEALGDFEDGGTSELWRGLKSAWRKVEKARAEGDDARLGAALDEAGMLIERGANQTKRVTRVLDLLERRRKHATAETKRRLSEEGTFSYETAAAYYLAIGAAARKHFSHDQRALTAFLNEVTAIGGAASVDFPATTDGE